MTEPEGVMTSSRSLAIGPLLLLLIGAGIAAPVRSQDAFNPPCEIPYRHIATAGLDIDATCGPDGAAANDDHKAQNRAKNNLCAQGQPVPLTFAAFKALQKAVKDKGIRFGSSNSLPEDRAELEDIVKIANRRVGEGDVVRYVGFLHNPRYSNTAQGESVNCKRGGQANNDIHVDIVRTRDEPACRSVTAEIIPHFRPRAWEVDQLRQVVHPVRFTGHLFFDASHKPCEPGKVHNPKRISVWEIHPVYQIEVCRFKSIANCGVRGTTEWLPLDQWLNIPIDEEDTDGSGGDDE